jgi:predicted membrane protein
MNEEKFKKEVEERWGGDRRHRRHGRVWSGLLLLVIGGLLLVRGIEPLLFPGWFFTWPMLLIAIGLISGFRHGFRGPFWIIMVVVGGIFLAGEINPSMDVERFTWPLILIAIGISFILRPHRRRRWERCGYGRFDHRYKEREMASANASTQSFEDTGSQQEGDRGDFVDVTSVFGGVKKNVLSKNFKGGDIVSFMGGSEIDLTQADFNGRVTIDATAIFGGTKLIVPSSWDVHNDITAVFGGVDDKRQIHGVTMDPNKVLILDGTCLFGGIEIRSY